MHPVQRWLKRLNVKHWSRSRAPGHRMKVDKVLVIIKNMFSLVVNYPSRGYLFLLLLFSVSSSNAQPFSVSSEVTISSGDWFPLPVEDMKAAAADTALAELTKGGLFSISAEEKQNKLRLEISLIGPAETAKLTINVNLKDQPTYISTASISVHDMDYQGIYNAFEHIGLVAAQRLNDKTEALVIKPRMAANSTSLPNNKELQKIYNQAQKLKRQYQYKKSRILFEQVAAATGEGSERLSALAKDELKYGLTVFEAKQSTVAMGSGDAKAISRSIRNAENLYRQILAENSDNLLRTQEAQSALDNLSVSSNALKNVLRAQTLMAANSVRMMLQQQYMMTGVCPDKKETSQYVSTLHTKVTVKSVKKKPDETRYTFMENSSGNPFNLSCSNERITVVN